MTTTQPTDAATEMATEILGKAVEAAAEGNIWAQLLIDFYEETEEVFQAHQKEITGIDLQLSILVERLGGTVTITEDEFADAFDSLELEADVELGDKSITYTTSRA